MPPRKKNLTDMPLNSKPKKKASSKPSGHAKYILLIMVLICIIAVMAVKYSKRQQSQIPVQNKNTPAESTSSEGDSVRKADAGDAAAQVSAGGDAANGIQKVKVYFLDVDPRTEKVLYRPVYREVSSRDSIKGALEILAKGINETEKKSGMMSGIPSSLKIKSVSVVNSIALVDVSADFLKDAYGDIATGRVNQVYHTVRQFPEVKGLEIRVNGKKIKSLGGDGIVIHWPMRKPL